ncbi:hypothetical protein JHK87_031949 [Glycine soja]|nr:hypothetical protein JHK87_031949 [Glycine soja]
MAIVVVICQLCDSGTIMPKKKGRGQPKGSYAKNCQESAHGNLNSCTNPSNMVEVDLGCEELEDEVNDGNSLASKSFEPFDGAMTGCACINQRMNFGDWSENSRGTYNKWDGIARATTQESAKAIVPHSPDQMRIIASLPVKPYPKYLRKGNNAPTTMHRDT